MVRLLVFALHADERMEFTRGLCVGDEPAMWVKSLSGEIEKWVEIGRPDERRIRKACSRARQVLVYAYGGRAADLWWKRVRHHIRRYGNLRVFSLSRSATRSLASLAARSMRLQCTIQDGRIWLGTAKAIVPIEPRKLVG